MAPKLAQIEFNGQAVHITFKPIKNLNLKVSHPDGQVHVSAPLGMRVQTIEGFLAQKKHWIEKHQTRLKSLPPKPANTYQSGEMHAVWGHEYRLEIGETSGRQHVECTPGLLTLYARRGATQDHKKQILEAWYRQTLREAAGPMMAQWAQHMEVSPKGLFVQRMTTRWGSCNTRRHTIRLNTDLVHKPQELLEYVVVHELVHLFERYHNARFYQLMSQFLPDWKQKRRRLNGAQNRLEV
ncbi:M48 family metallopeptidase [Alphaproteobacteria bacterium]|nr:M48 family metallopeptidase [Alphaproteobacteria bacterium]MDC0131452.1 M48 family metallopeptidase [Alphaproteobacteria bacterium]